MGGVCVEGWGVWRMVPILREGGVDDTGCTKVAAIVDDGLTICVRHSLSLRSKKTAWTVTDQ